MATSAATVAAWVDLYRAAWLSNDPDDIRAAFAEDAEYRDGPNSEPWVGHADIVERWLAQQDAPGDTTFEWQPVALEADTAVIRCLTTYPGRVFDNLWVLRLADDGRAREFTDWYIER
ncbi:MAG: hypothetical protein BGO97_00480 [Micrococcales bacterium 70-64]|nr:nuclear transport factor 2 family protein [Leifsonia sp.]ODU65706.1 MAG: hypothetical protein ABT06_00480 [Leifsonia sp. SCN 70-46]OJX84333.1 MAG: hypothetical protein BGO97_00480 [Micrococcales bacterium 70-64]